MSTSIARLTLQLADEKGLAWAQQMVSQYHYLHAPVDVRSSPVAYIVLLESDRVGCLIFGRPEATRVYGWYGGLEDTLRGRSDPKFCPLTRWQVLNLARIWLSQDVQREGQHYIPNAGTYIIGQVMKRVPYDFLIARPPVWCDEPYEIRQVLSYCDRSVHQGTLYRAANFELMRTNERGIQTYVRDLRRLTHVEHVAIRNASLMSERARRLRSERGSKQMQLHLDSLFSASE